MTIDLATRLAELLDEHKAPGGAVALYRDGAIVDSAHYGVANLETGVEVDGRTLFHIGSNTKVFNTTLLLQCVEDGLLDLDAPVQQYLPDFTLADAAAAKHVTVKSLVNHSSGIDCDMYEQPEYDCDRVIDGYHQILGAPSLFRAGEGHAYSNGATLVAGHLVQVVRQRGWYELVKERIFNPLEMANAIAHPLDGYRFRYAKGHVSNPETGVVEPSTAAFLPLGMAPAGATLSMTAVDQAKFAAAHLRDGLGLNGARILSEASAQLMRTITSSVTVGGFTSSFGLGWGVGANGIVRHAGAGIGTAAQIILHVPSGTALSVMSNADVGMNAISALAGEFLRGEFDIDPMGHYQPVPEQPDLALPVDKIVGRYASAVAWWGIGHKDGKFVLSGGPCKDGVPNFDVAEFGDVPMVPLDETSFMAKPDAPEKLGGFGMFMSMPVGVGGEENGQYQQFLAGTRVYKRIG